MRKYNSTAFIIFTGVLILLIFTEVSIINIMPNNNMSDSYYAKTDKDMQAKVEKLSIIDNKLYIITSGDPAFYCVKTTKSVPKENSICFKEMKNNNVSVSIYANKKYYVWLKDSKGNISKMYE